MTKHGSPGPGEYQPKSVNDGPSFSFRPRTSAKPGDVVPGPGNYNPKAAHIKEKAPSWIVGKSERSGMTSSNVPGPGTYFNESSLVGPKWGFGSGKRTQQNGPSAPGPGTYEIKSTVGAVPSYVSKH